ncbi:MAG TPA: hypothetical protein VFZ48_01370, partial [Candidatus Saccharimonadales bacterium]
IDEANTQAFQQFASTNDLTFLPEEKFTGEKGSLFAEGHSQRVRNILSGQSQGLPFKLFNFEYTIGHGKYSHSHRLSVLSVTLPHNMPQLVIDSLVEAGSGRSSTLPITFDDSQKIHLEGDFSQFFDVYAPKNHGIDALTILAPDVMRTLLQQEAVCDIEIIEDRIYFYWPLYPERREHYEKILTVFETIMAQIAPPILRMEDAVAAQKTMETTATPTSLLRAESPLKALIPIILSVILYATMSFVVEEWAAEGDVSDLMKLVPIFVWGLFLLGSLYYWYRRRQRRNRLQRRYGKEL